MPPTSMVHGMSARIARSAGVISLSTSASRILGFVRDLLIAKLFGTGIQAQAFVVAFRLPNLFRDLVAEGAVNTAIVPVLSATKATQAPQEFWRLTQALAVRVTVAVSVVGALGVAVAPWLVRLIAPGFTADPEKFSLTVAVTRLLFPFLTLVGWWAFACGVLNSLHRFALPALGPAVLNLCMIGGCLWIVPHVQPGVVGLGWAILLGGAIQLVMLLPGTVKLGFRWRWVWRHPGSGQVMRLLMPRVVGAAVYQISVLFNTILASFSLLVGEGAVAALYFANRLVQLPLALFAAASAQASLPVLSERAAVGDRTAFASTIVGVLRLVAFESLPAAVGLFVLATPIVQLCFERGAFDAGSTQMTASAVRLFAIGLMSYAAIRILSGAFYALQDTRTPVRLAAEALAANVALAVALVVPLRVGGLALATALASSLNAWRLLRQLERRLQTPLTAALVRPIARIAAASALMGLGCAWAWHGWGQHRAPLVGLPAVIVGGIIGYGLIALAIRIPEASAALPWLAPRLTTPRSPRA